MVLAVLSVYAYWKAASTWALALIGLAALFAIFTVFAPKLLAPFNRLWFGFGMLLGKIVSPVVLGMIYFLLITPVSLVTRLWGRDVLLMKKRAVISYWIDRNPTGPAPASFKKQF